MLGYALYRITKWKYQLRREGKKPGEYIWIVEEFPDLRQKGGLPDSRTIWLCWWKEGQTFSDQRFERLYNEWKQLRGQNKQEQAKKKYQRIIDVGIAALPKIMEKIEQGDTTLIEAVSKLTDKKVKTNAKKSECIDWWKKNKQKWLIPFEKSGSTQEPKITK